MKTWQEIVDWLHSLGYRNLQAPPDGTCSFDLYHSRIAAIGHALADLQMRDAQRRMGAAHGGSPQEIDGAGK